MATIVAAGNALCSCPLRSIQLSTGSSANTSLRFSPQYKRAVFRASRSTVSAKLAKLSVTESSTKQADFLSNEENQFQVAKTMAGSLFLLLANSGSACAAQEVFQVAEDSRPLILLLVLGPAVGWVLFNILKPALSQFDKMKGAKSIIGGLGLGAAGSLLLTPSADAAQEVAQLAADNRPLILLFILGPAVGWVLFNILKPALNQFDKMKGVKSVIGGLGIGATALLSAQDAEAAQEVAQLAADNRPLILLFILGPAVGWVLFNILQPALRQFDTMSKKKK